MTGVRTASGDIEAEIVVNCAGQWAKQVGAWCGVSVPLHSCEHFYVVTEQIDGVHRDLPILRDPDGYTYFKEEVGGLVVGGFEPNAKPWVAPDALPHPFEFQLLPEDWDHFSLLADEAQLRVPALRTTGSRRCTTARRASPPTTSSSSARRRSAATSSSRPGSTRSASRPRAALARRWPSGSSPGTPAST